MLSAAWQYFVSEENSYDGMMGGKLTYCPRKKPPESKDHCMVWAVFDLSEFITEMWRFGFTVLEGDEDLFTTNR
jgi:hypothetical protein